MDPIFDGAAPPLPLFASPAPTICSWSVWFKLISTRSGAGEQRGRTNTRVHYSCLPWRYGNRALLLWLAIKKVASLAIILLLGVDSKFSGCCRRPRCQSPPVVWLLFFFFLFFSYFPPGRLKGKPCIMCSTQVCFLTCLMSSWTIESHRHKKWLSNFCVVTWPTHERLRSAQTWASEMSWDSEVSQRNLSHLSSNHTLSQLQLSAPIFIFPSQSTSVSDTGGLKAQYAGGKPGRKRSSRWRHLHLNNSHLVAPEYKSPTQRKEGKKSAIYSRENVWLFLQIQTRFVCA